MHYDYLIIGGGIIGLSTAWQLQQRRPDSKILLLEKEAQLALHQSSHNSGVIHAGLYYNPKSLKASFCREGAIAMRRFCQQENIPCQQTGKLLVATDTQEYQRMQDLYHRCLENQVAVEWLNQAQLHQREPNISGRGALYIAETGMVDYAVVASHMAQRFIAMGGEIRLNTTVTGLAEKSNEVIITTSSGEFHSNQLIVCAGLMADRLVKMAGLNVNFQIIPFRGEYYCLPASLSKLINHQIYPIPDPSLPFLGVHLTRTIDGRITVGPNAVLGLHREGHEKFSFNNRDAMQIFGFSGFWRLLAKNLKPGFAEMKSSLLKSSYLKLVQKYCPQLRLDDLQPYPAGIRAQAVLKDGTLVHDFLFKQTARTLHVCNAPSPAATSSIPIGAHLCDKVIGTKDLPELATQSIRAS